MLKIYQLIWKLFKYKALKISFNAIKLGTQYKNKGMLHNIQNTFATKKESQSIIEQAALQEKA